MRKLVSVFLILFFLLIMMRCTPFEHKNPYDPETKLQDPKEMEASIKYIKSIGPNYVELKWDRNVDPNFYFYGVALSKTPIDADSFDLTGEMEEELKKISYYDAAEEDFDIRTAAPKFAAASKIVQIIPYQNYTEFYSDEVMTLPANTKYYFCIYVFLRNFYNFSYSEEITFFTTPAMDSAVWAYVDTEMAESFQVLYDIEVDQNYLYVSGMGYRIHQAITNTNNTDFGYFIRKVNLSDISYIGSDSTILISGGVADFHSTIYKVFGFTVDPSTTNNLYVPDQIEGELYKISAGTYLDSTKITNLSFFDDIIYMGFEDGILYEAGDGIIRTRDINSLIPGINFWDLNKYGYLKFHGIDADAYGNIYVVAWETAEIIKFTAVHEIEWVIGGRGKDLGKLNNPHDLVIHYENNVGYIYVADTGNGRIQKFDLDGNFVSVIDLFEHAGNLMTEPRGLAIGEGITVSDGGTTLSGDILFIASKAWIVGIVLPD